MSGARIDLHVEELVLEGFRAADRHAIGAAVERELARLLAERGLPPGLARGAELSHLDGGSFEARPGARPERVGGQVARQVAGALHGASQVMGAVHGSQKVRATHGGSEGGSER